MEVGEEGDYIPRCHLQNDSCIKMGSDESHFNVSVGSDGQSHKTVSTNHNLSEEKGEPKRYRTEVLPLTSLSNALPLGQASSLSYATEGALFISAQLSTDAVSALRKVGY